MSASAGDMAPNTIKKDAEKMLFYTLSDLKTRGGGFRTVEETGV